MKRTLSVMSAIGLIVLVVGGSVFVAYQAYQSDLAEKAAQVETQRATLQTQIAPLAWPLGDTLNCTEAVTLVGLPTDALWIVAEHTGPMIPLAFKPEGDTELTFSPTVPADVWSFDLIAAPENAELEGKRLVDIEYPAVGARAYNVECP